MPAYQIYRLKEIPRQQFRWTPHTPGVAIVKLKDYEPGPVIHAASPYALWLDCAAAAKPSRSAMLSKLSATRPSSAASSAFSNTSVLKRRSGTYRNRPPRHAGPSGGNIGFTSMYNDPGAWDRVNSFALVSYIPEPLAGFLDRLRQELVPNCFLKAHVTILPPRPICSSPEAAWKTVRTRAPLFQPFEVELTQLEVFPVSDVIYIEIGRGREGAAATCTPRSTPKPSFVPEPYPYHPHITLAQNLKGDEVDELGRVARARWAECKLPKTFRVDKVVFVQNTRRNCWLDLGESALGHQDSRLVGELLDLLAG
jgi:2'-5' RNA ligase